MNIFIYTCINVIRCAVKDQANGKDGKAGTFLAYPTRPPPTLTVTNTVGMGGGIALHAAHGLPSAERRGPGTTPGYQGAVVPRENKTGALTVS